MLQLKSWFADLSLWGIIFLGLIFCTSCRDEVQESPIPKNRVQFSCDITLVNIYMEQGSPQTPLESSTGYVRCYDKKKMAGNEYWGTGGLLLVHGFEVGQYFAYDLACPYCYATHATSSSKVHQLTIGGKDFTTAICPDCESEYGSVFWGSPAPTKGPANEENYILRQYKARLAGDKLVVTN